MIKFYVCKVSESRKRLKYFFESYFDKNESRNHVSETELKMQSFALWISTIFANYFIVAYDHVYLEYIYIYLKKDIKLSSLFQINQISVITMAGSILTDT